MTGTSIVMQILVVNFVKEYQPLPPDTNFLFNSILLYGQRDSDVTVLSPLFSLQSCNL